MSLTYEPSLVLLSLVLAIQGSYVALRIALQISDSQGQARRRLLLAGAAGSLAVGIWGMHFVATLAVRLPMSVNYLVLPTLLSFLICMLVVGVGLGAVSLWPRTYFTLGAASAVMGSGIAAMHYTGMWALHASTHMTHNPILVAVSILISIVTSAMALWLTFDKARRLSLFVSATVLGLAISGMHYTAMAGTALVPLTNQAPLGSPAVSPDLLAIIVAVVAFSLSGAFLLTFVPDRPANDPSLSNVAPSPRVDTEARKQPDFLPAVPGTEQATGVSAAEPLASQALTPKIGPDKLLPFERDGVKRFIQADLIFAVRADAHYTLVFDGVDTFFCPLAIGEVEEQLSGGSFLRVHRSHLVNLEYVKGVRRSGDNAVAELTTPSPYKVPVSRQKFNELQAKLQERSIVGAQASGRLRA